MFKANVELKFFGWEFDQSVNADKIWGWAEVEGKIYNFWGRRGTEKNPFKHISFKRFLRDEREVKTKQREKINKGYRSIDVTPDSEGSYPAVEKIYMGFSDHMKKQLMMARLSGTVQGEEF